MLYFIRHGQTDANLQRLNCGGEWDIKLNDTGREQARAFSAANASMLDEIDYVFVSPMKRALETAALVMGPREIERATHEGLREWHQGEWSGQQLSTLPNFFEDLSSAPGGEPFDAFQGRVMDELYSIARHPSKKGLVVGHGGVWLAYALFAKHHNRHLENCTLIDLCRDTLGRYRPIKGGALVRNPS